MTDVASRIEECVRARQSFLLDAGAGAGKTYSLVEALKLITSGAVALKSGQRIACITFTNVAKDEVVERTGHNPLIEAATIHDFLWSVIQPHQKALKAGVLAVNADLPPKSRRKKDEVELRPALEAVPVTYSDRGSNFLEGRLFHDDLLHVARAVFRANPLLSKLVAARYPFILVDEYQDTSRTVIDLLDVLLTTASQIVIGLFGDKLQNIYHGGEHPGIGELPSDFSSKLVRIVKEDNRRCSEAVIEVLNRIRTDIRQFPAADNARGDVLFIQAATIPAGAALARTKAYLAEREDWKAAQVKELYLTHRLIAQSCGYQDLLSVYAERGGFARDQFLSGEDATSGFFLRTVEPIVEAWGRGDTGRALTLLTAAKYRLEANGGKQRTRSALDVLAATCDSGTIGEVLDAILATNLLILPDTLVERLRGSAKTRQSHSDADDEEREAREAAFYEAFFMLPYAQLRSFAAFLLQHTPFATKHGVKGAEFDSVLVVLDDAGAGWNLYSFDKYLKGESTGTNAGRYERTRNLFYVCCSRTKRNLAVLDLGPASAAKTAGVHALFGAQNCVDV